jgi:hypothetical protein
VNYEPIPADWPRYPVRMTAGGFLLRLISSVLWVVFILGALEFRAQPDCMAFGECMRSAIGFGGWLVLAIIAGVIWGAGQVRDEQAAKERYLRGDFSPQRIDQ